MIIKLCHFHSFEKHDVVFRIFNVQIFVKCTTQTSISTFTQTLCINIPIHHTMIAQIKKKMWNIYDG